MKTHYQTLNVRADSSPELIAESAKALLLILQPRQNASEAAQQEYLNVARAYKVLSDPLLRAAYDADLHSQPASNANPAPPPEPVARSAQSKSACAVQDNGEHGELMAGYGIGLSSLNRVRKGEVSLAKAFWFYTLLLPNIFGFIVMLCIGFATGFTTAYFGNNPDTATVLIAVATGLITIAAFVYFLFFSLPGVWRSSRRASVSPFWRFTSRLIMLTYAFVIAMIILKAFLGNDTKPQASASHAKETPASIFADLEITESPAISSADAHYNAIYATHPDADNIVKSSEFKAWISSLKSEWRQEYERVLNEGTTDQVIGMLNSYEASKRYTIKSK